MLPHFCFQTVKVPDDEVRLCGDVLALVKKPVRSTISAQEEPVDLGVELKEAWRVHRPIQENEIDKLVGGWRGQVQEPSVDNLLLHF